MRLDDEKAMREFLIQQFSNHGIEVQVKPANEKEEKQECEPGDKQTKFKVAMLTGEKCEKIWHKTILEDFTAAYINRSTMVSAKNNLNNINSIIVSLRSILQRLQTRVPLLSEQIVQLEKDMNEVSLKFYSIWGLAPATRAPDPEAAWLAKDPSRLEAKTKQKMKFSCTIKIPRTSKKDNMNQVQQFNNFNIIIY